MTKLRSVQKEVESGLASLLTEFEEAKKKFAAEAQDRMKVAFKAVFDDYADLPNFSIFWVQYTPYWNDGEECTFRVGEVYVSNLEPHVAWQAFQGYEVDLSDDEEIEEQTYIWRHRAAEDALLPHFFIESSAVGGKYRAGFDVIDTTPGILRGRNNSKLLRLLEDIARMPDDVMKGTFGDHVRVMANRNGFDIDEFDHD